MMGNEEENELKQYESPTLDQLKETLCILEEKKKLFVSKKLHQLQQQRLYEMKIQALSHQLEKDPLNTKKDIDQRKTKSLDSSPQVTKKRSRKEELMDLQAQTMAALKKQKEAAEAIHKKLQSIAESNHVKRKREEEEQKKKEKILSTAAAVAESVNQKLHSSPKKQRRILSRVPSKEVIWDLSNSADVEIYDDVTFASLLYRLATRYYLQTMTLVSIEALEQKVLESTGKDCGTLMKQIQLQVKKENCEPTLANFILASSAAADLSLMVSGVGNSSCGHPFYWRPGAKWLSNATFSSGITPRLGECELNVLLKQAISYEKNAVESACSAQEQMKSVTSMGKSDGHKYLLEESRCLHFIQATLGLFSTSNSKYSNIASACLEPHMEPVCGPSFHPFHELSRILSHSYEALGQANNQKTVGISKRYSSAVESQLSFNRPFDLDQESVLHQLRRYEHSEETSPTTTTIAADPMGILCIYELNGVCNDENCEYQHQRDFITQSSTPTTSSKATVSKRLSRELLVLEEFREWRHKIQEKNDLPLLGVDRVDKKNHTSINSVAVTSEEDKDESLDLQKVQENKQDEEGEDGFLALPQEDDEMEVEVGADAAQMTEDRDDTMEQDEVDIVPIQILEDQETLDPSLSARYCATSLRTNAESTVNSSSLVDLSMKQLEVSVHENPENVTAWCLLALRALDLPLNTMEMSENLVRMSGLNHYKALMEALHDQLRWQLPASVFWKRRKGMRFTVISPEGIEKALHILSRALEVEANVEKRILWQFYLNLYQLLSIVKADEQEDIRANRKVHQDLLKQGFSFISSNISTWNWRLYNDLLWYPSVHRARHGLRNALTHIEKLRGDDDECGNDIPSLSASRQLKLQLIFRYFDLLMAAENQQEIMTFCRHLLGDESIVKDTELESVLRDVNALKSSELMLICILYGYVALYDKLPEALVKYNKLWSQGESGTGKFILEHKCLMEEMIYPDQEDCLVASTTGGISTEMLQSVMQAFVQVYSNHVAVVEQESTDQESYRTVKDIFMTNFLVVSSLVDNLPNEDGPSNNMNAWLGEETSGVTQVLQECPLAMYQVAKYLSAMQGQEGKAQRILLDAVQQTGSCSPVGGRHLYHYLVWTFPLAVESETPQPEFTMKDNGWMLQFLADSVREMSYDQENFVKQMESEAVSSTKTLKKFLNQLASKWMDGLRTAKTDIYVLMSICLMLGVFVNMKYANELLDKVLESLKCCLLPIESQRFLWKSRFCLETLWWRRAHTTTEEEEEEEDIGGFADKMMEFIKRYFVYVSSLTRVDYLFTEKLYQYQDERALSLDEMLQKSLVLDEELEWTLVRDERIENEMVQFVFTRISLLEQKKLLHMCTHWLTQSPLFVMKTFVQYHEQQNIPMNHEEMKILSKCMDQNEPIGCSGLSQWTSIHPLGQLLRKWVQLQFVSKHFRKIISKVDDLFFRRPHGHLVVSTWQLAIAIEILLGPCADEKNRTKRLVKAIDETNIHLQFNLYGDTRENIYSLLQWTQQSNEDTSVVALTGQTIFPLSLCIRDQIALGAGRYLTELYLTDGFLTEFPSEIGHLTKLTILDVSRNSLLTLPSSLSELKELCKLNVAQNHLKSATLLDVFRTTSSLLSTLKVLDIRDNLIQVLPNTIPKKMLVLKKLLIRGNVIVADQTKALSDACQAMGCEVDVMEDKQEEKKAEAVLESSKGPLSEPIQMEVIEIESSSDSNSSTPHSHNQGSYSGTEILEMEVDQTSANAELQEGESSEEEGTEELVEEEEEEEEEEILDEEEQLKSSFVRLQEYLQGSGRERHEVKRLRPRLWRSFVQDNVPFLTSLGSCVLCSDSSAPTQRFNSMVLCPSCIHLSLDLLEQEEKHQEDK